MRQKFKNISQGKLSLSPKSCEIFVPRVTSISRDRVHNKHLNKSLEKIVYIFPSRNKCSRIASALRDGQRAKSTVAKSRSTCDSPRTFARIIINIAQRRRDDTSFSHASYRISRVKQIFELGTKIKR